MKRGAERQITDRDEEEDDRFDPVEEGEGFKPAAQQEIAKRQIRGLPGRKAGGSNAASPAGSRPSTPGAGPAPSFGGFANSTAPKSPSSFSGFAFGTTPSAPSGPAENTSIAASQKPASNGFAFGAATSSISAKPSSSNEDPDVAYYASLRGLNLSVIPPLQKLLDKDPFMDLSEALTKILGRYKEERSKIEGKQGSTASKEDKVSSQENGKANAAANGASKSNFSFGGSSTAPSSTDKSTSNSNASVPKPFSGFAFGATPTSTPSNATSTKPASSTSTSSAESTAAAAAPKPFAGFAFNKPTSTPAASSAPSKSPEAEIEEYIPPVSTKSFAGFASGKAPSFTASDIPKPSSPALAPAASDDSASTAKKEEGKKIVAPPAPPAAFTFAGNSFKPDASKTLSSTASSGARPAKGGFVFTPPTSNSKDTEETSLFSFPASRTNDEHKKGSSLAVESSDQTKSASSEPSSATTRSQKSASPAPATSSTSVSATNNTSNSGSGLSSSASAFMPAGNSRARQPSPLRQVETVPTDEKTTTKPKPFAGFSFNPTPASTPTASATPGSTGTTASPPKTVSFGSSSTSPKANTPSFSFGGGGSPKPTFNSNVGFSFGSSSSSTTPAASGPPSFSFGTKPASFTTAAPVSGSAFGSNTSAFGSNGIGSAFGTSPTTTSGSAFGSSATATAPSSTSSGGFGGFSFSKPASSTSTGAGAFGASSSLFPTPSSSTNGITASTTEAEADSDAPPSEPSQNSLLAGGVGEENESTLYEARAKLWKHETKEGSDKKEFVEHGISILKLKKDTQSGKVRILGRSDANGRVQVNFTLFPKLQLNQEKGFITFLGFEGTEPMLFRLRLKNIDLAGKFKEAVEEQVGKL